MDPRQLGYFLAVTTHGGFGRAAPHLHVSQPALSQAVAALERELGVPLLHRVPTGVRLTDAGEALVPLARQILRDLEAAAHVTRAVGGGTRGRVDLALMPSQAVEPFARIVQRLTAGHPGLSVRATAAFGREEAVELVRQGACELALVGALTAPYPRGIDHHTLERQEMVLVAPPGCGLPAGRPLVAADLDRQRLVVSPPGSVMRHTADALMAGSTMEVVVEVEHRDAILPLVLAGVGVAVLSTAWEGLARRAGATVLRLTDTAQVRVDLVHRAGKLTPVARVFLDEALSVADQPS